MLSTNHFSESTLSSVNALHYNCTAFENSDLTSLIADRTPDWEHQKSQGLRNKKMRKAKDADFRSPFEGGTTSEISQASNLWNCSCGYAAVPVRFVCQIPNNVWDSFWHSAGRDRRRITEHHGTPDKHQHSRRANSNQQ